MATPLENSYTRVVGSPINASGGGRPGGDNIAISFTPGKKSTQQQLDELAIQKAKDDLARLSLVPVGSEQQKYEWAAENQRLAQEAATRAATQAAVDIQQRELALQQSKAMAPLDIQAQIESIQSSQLAQQGSQLAQREQRLTLPGELAAQQASLEAQRLSAQQAQQSIAQASKINPLNIQSAEMQIAQSKLTNPLDVKAKQVGIQGAQQSMYLASLDQMYKDQAYRDSHSGMTPSQVNTTQAFSAQRRASSGGAVGSAADDAYMKAVYGSAYRTTADQMAASGVKYRAPTSGVAKPAYVLQQPIYNNKAR